MWVLVMLFVIFRRRILIPIIGTVNFYLFDAIMWAIFAGWYLANPGPITWLGYGCSVFSVYWSFDAGRWHLKLAEIVRKNREQSKPNT